MLAAALRVVLLALVALGAFVAASLDEAHGRGARVFAFLAVVAGPAVIVALLAAVLAWLNRTPTPAALRIGWLARIGCIVIEAFWFAVVYLVLQPFPRLVLPGEEKQRVGDRLPVLLLPGFMCNAGLWAWFARALRRRGHAVFTHAAEPVFGAIDGYADALATRIAALSAAAGDRRVALVGHSMGGLIARSYLRKHGASRVACLVTIGSPHHGSALAPFGYGANAREMRRTAAWLGGLAAFDEGRFPVPVTSIFSYQDNFVAPQASSELAGAVNVPLAGLGHMSLVFSPRVVARTHEALAAVRRGGAADTLD